jgi:hypothetical protein
MLSIATDIKSSMSASISVSGRPSRALAFWKTVGRDGGGSEKAALKASPAPTSSLPMLSIQVPW